MGSRGVRSLQNLKAPGITVQLPSTPMSSDMMSDVDSSDESPPKVEISPCILAVERKQGLYRNPKLWTFEKGSEMEDRYDAARSLYRGPLFQNYMATVKSVNNSHSALPKNDIPSYGSKKEISRELDIKDTSDLSFAEKTNVRSMFDKGAELILFKTHEVEGRRLDADGQPPRMKLLIRNVVDSSSLLRDLLLDKHKCRLDDEYDIIIYHPDKTLDKKSYLDNVAIYADALLHDGEVHRRAGNDIWQQLDEDTIWWGLQVYARWVRTDYVILEGEGDIDARGRAAVLTAKYLGFADLEYYRDRLKQAVGEDNYENWG